MSSTESIKLKSESAVVKLKQLNFLYTHTGEQLVGDLFPGFGLPTPEKPSTIVGTSDTVAHFDHTHYTDDLKELANPTNVLVTKTLRDKLVDLPDRDELNAIINQKIENVDWQGAVNTYQELLDLPANKKYDGATYGVYTDTKIGSTTYPAGTYRYHDATEHSTGDGDTSGFKLISISSTPLATADYAGTISSQWYSKLKTILDTGFTGLPAVNATTGTGSSTLAARADHTHGNYLQNETGISDTTKSQKIGTDLLVPLSFNIKADGGNTFITYNENSHYVRFGSANQKLIFGSRSIANENIEYVKGNATGFIWDSFNLPKTTIDSLIKGGAFPGYAGTGNDWGSSDKVARSDHKHSDYFKIVKESSNDTEVHFGYRHYYFDVDDIAICTQKTDGSLSFFLGTNNNFSILGEPSKELQFYSDKRIKKIKSGKGYYVWDTEYLPDSTVTTLKDIVSDGISKIKNALKITFNGGTTEGTDMFTYNGSAAKNINLSASTFGAAPANHSHKYAGSSSAGGSANSTKGALSITVGSNTAVVFNGSENKSVSITTATIGAAASSHTHDYLPKAGGTMSGEINMGGRQITNCANILFSSDKRLKNVLRQFDVAENEEVSKNIFSIPAFDFYFKKDKNQKLHCGYIAQNVREIAPEFVEENEKGILSVDYTSIHTKKIAVLEQLVSDLKDEILMLKKHLS